MPTNLSYIVPAKLLLLLLSHLLQNHCYHCYRYYCCCYYYQNYSYYCATDHFSADNKSPGVAELATQLLILASILWLPLCQIYKFGLNTLPSKTVAIPYTCGLSLLSYSHSLTLSRSKQDDGVHSISSLRLSQIWSNPFRWWSPVAREEANVCRLLWPILGVGGPPHPCSLPSCW